MGTIQLGAFIFDDADLLDIMGPMRIFGEEMFNELNLTINFIGTSMKPVKAAQKIILTPHYTLDNAPKMDLFFIPGGPGIRPIMANPRLMRQVKARVEESTWTMTVCTGAAVLAKTGLMNGYKMTTNKKAFEWVVNNSIDAALYIVSELRTPAVAENVANFIEYTWHKNSTEDPFADLYPYTRS
ncbi:hypothetical protein BGX28_009549 [Mortierella sp. GBA30]|nr:hypothetical protein BGX28_009549 [Mortierella sp. GBA30]